MSDNIPPFESAPTPLSYGVASNGKRMTKVVIMLFVVGLAAVLALISTRPLQNLASNRVRCASNLRSLATALFMYQNANRGWNPASLTILMDDQTIAGSIFICPSTSDTPGTTGAQLRLPRKCSYQYLPRLSITQPMASQVMIYENPGNHGKDGMNVLFGDEHVEFLIQSEAQKILDQVKAGKTVVTYSPPP